MIRIRLFALFMVLSLGSGCGGSGLGSVGSNATATDFCRSMIDEIVAAGARCAGGSDFSWRDQYTGSVPCDQVDGLLAAGTLTYDRATGADCLTQLNQMDCVGEVLPEWCKDAIAGRLPAGSQCSFFANGWFSDCAPGNYCHYPGNACGGGTCQPYVQPGGSCAYTDAGGYPRCASGSSCNKELCVPNVGEGEICWGDSAAGDCGDGLYCDFRATNPAICRKRRTSGVCADGFECAAGTVCAGPANTKTCTTVKLPGDSCTQGQSECFGLSFCGDDGKCTRTGVAENQLCGANPQAQGEYIQCGIDLYCASTVTLVDPSVGTVGGVGTCQAKKPAGSNCSYWTECAGNLAYCDSATRLCVACGGSTAIGVATGMGGAGGGSDIPASTGGAGTTGGPTGGTGGAAGGTGSGGSFATYGVPCPLPTRALITDFTYSPADGGASSTSSVHFGDSTTLQGTEYVYPTSGSCPVTSDVTQSNWHLSGTLGDYSGFGLNLDNCSRVDASAYLGIQFTISGSVPQGNIVTLGMGTLNNTIAASWLNAHGGSSGGPGRCLPKSGANQYDQPDCKDAKKDIPVTAMPTPVKVLWSEFTGGNPEPGVTPTDIISIYWYFPNPPEVGTAAVVPYPVDIVIDDLQFITP